MAMNRVQFQRGQPKAPASQHRLEKSRKAQALMHGQRSGRGIECRSPEHPTRAPFASG